MMRIKMTVTAVFRRNADDQTRCFHCDADNVSSVDEFIGIAATSSEYESLRASAMEGHEERYSRGVIDIVSEIRELEFDVLPEMIL